MCIRDSANLVYWSGVMPISEGSGGLFFAVSSYCGKLFISPTSSPVIVPDPEFLAQCLRESIAETVHSARQRLAAPTSTAKGRSKGGGCQPENAGKSRAKAAA